MFELYESQIFMHSLAKMGLTQEITLCGSAIFSKKISNDELQIAANKILKENPSLRTYFIENGGKIYQEYESYSKRVFQIKHFNSIEEMDEWGKLYATIPQDYKIIYEDKNKKDKIKTPHSIRLILNYLRQKSNIKKRKKKLGLSDTTLSCFDFIIIQLPNVSGAFIKMNHIISDGWSMYLVANQFLKALNNESFKTYEYKDYIENDKKYKISQRGLEDREFFKNEWLKNPKPTICFPGDINSFEAKRNEFEFDELLSNKIKEYCLVNNLSESVLFIACTGIYLRKKIKDEKFYLGMLSLNRNGLSEKKSIGLFVSTLPLLMDIPYNMTFEELLNNTKEKSISILRHGKGYANPTEAYGNYFDFFISFRNSTLDSDKNIRIKEYFSMAFGNFVQLSIENNFNSGKYVMYFDHNIKIKDNEALDLLNGISKIISKGIDNKKSLIKDILEETCLIK